MAELAEPPGISAGVQLGAVAWLRWRIFVNSFRKRQAGGRQIGGLILGILLRLILWPIFAVWVIGPVGAAGFFAWTAIAHHQPMWLLALLTGVAILWQFVAVNGTNIAASMQTFDPASLLRFPVPFGRYLLLRTMLGLLTASTIVGCLALAAVVVGIGIADPRLLWMAVPAMGLYALMNIFFARMVGIWLERMLAARRMREIFGGLLAIVAVSFQFLQFGHPRHRHVQAQQSWVFEAAMRWSHAMHWLPPGYAADSVLDVGRPAARTGNMLLLLGWTAVFLAGFAYRLHKQYLGEYLSEGAAPGPSAASVPARMQRRNPVDAKPAAPMAQRFGTPASAVPVMLRKEWLTLRSNSGQLIGLLTPLIFVFIMSRGLFGNHPAYLLPGAVGYAILAPMVGAYNIFGAEAAGVQLYLLAPVRMRDVVLAKNISNLALLAVEAGLAWAIAVGMSAAPIGVAAQVSALLWVAFVLVVNLTLGTLRSIQSPRRFVPGQTRQMRAAPASRTSGLLVIAVVLGSVLLQVPVTRLGRALHAPWLAAGIFGCLALAALGGYAVMLRNVDALVMRNRDVIEQELCGVS